MKKLLSLRLFFFTILISITFACSSQNVITKSQSKLEVYDTIESEIALRPWETQGLGKVIGKEILTVLKTKDNSGDVVVLRWSDKGTTFSAEIYRSKPDDIEHSTWSLVSDDEEKTLAYQYGDLYMIHQLIPGKDGGQKTQLFKLPSR